jgi:hypothetical protein
MFLGLPDPDPLSRGTDPAPDPGFSIIPNFLLLCVFFLYDFLSLKNDVDVP